MESTFVFVDLAGFTALTEAHGGGAAADLVERFTELVDGALAGDAERVRTIGDAVFLVAPRPALALRLLGRVWTRALSQDGFLALRAGAHHGDAVRRGADYFGTAVNIAARITAIASGGQVVVTSGVADVARDEGRQVTTLGSFVLKNLRDRVDLYSVQLLLEEAAEVVDPVCRMQVIPAKAAAHVRIADRDVYFCSVECAATFLATVPKPSS
jgi:adenylate cyclase